MHILGSILFVFFVVSVYPTAAKPKNGYCDECIYYSFEQDFDNLFTRAGICIDLEPWVKGIYSFIDVERPNEDSRGFITPLFELSCAVSFPFPMTGGGRIETLLYMDSARSAELDQIYVLAEQISATGVNNPTVGMGVRNSLEHGFVDGWFTLGFDLTGSDAFNGHLIFMGEANANSTVLVDSFCYKPAHYEGDCWVGKPGATTVEPTTVTETEPTTVTETTTSVATETTPVTEEEPTTLDPTVTEPTETTLVTEQEPTTAESTETEPTSVTEDEPITSIPTVTVPEQTTEDGPITAVPTVTEPAVTETSPTIVTEITTEEGPITSIPTVTVPEQTTEDGPITAVPTVTEPAVTETSPTIVTEITTEGGPITSIPTVTVPEQTTEDGPITAVPTVTEPAVTATSPTIVTEITTEEGPITSIPTVTVPEQPTEDGPITVVPTVTEPTSVTEPGITVTDPIFSTESTPVTEKPSTTVRPPKPTNPTPAPGSFDQCPEDQSVHWLLPHEDNCNLFYYCVWGEKVLRECPSGLYFNPTLQVCDWPNVAGCTTQ